MKSYGYFFVLNHIALAVDDPNKVEAFKRLVELDMLNRASDLVHPDADSRAAKIVRELTQALYPVSADATPTIEQRMMLVRALHDQELESIVGNMRFFVPFAYTKEELVDRFGFFDDGNALSIPYFLRNHFLRDQAVFCDGKLTSFADAAENGTITANALRYGLLCAQAYGKNDIPERYKDLPLF